MTNPATTGPVQPRSPSGTTAPSARRPLLRAALPLLLLAVLALEHAAQAPKVGREQYVDNVDLGFEIKRPKDWDLVPPKPDEENLIAKFTPRFVKFVQLTQDVDLAIDVLLVRFDKRLESDDEDDLDEKLKRLLSYGVADVEEFIEKRLPSYYGSSYRFDAEDYPKELKGIRDVESRYTIYTGSANNDPQNPVESKLFVSEYVLNERTTVAMIGIGPGERKWREYEKAYEKLAKSFARVEIIDPFEEARNAADADTPRGKKRLKLLEEAWKTGEWTLYETENYFIISASDDKDFLEELEERLEAIRDVYETDYPAEKARRSTQGPETGEVEGEEGGIFAPPSEEEEEDPDAANRTVSVIDPLELSKTSVVRVCRSRSDYMEYGAPGSSAGYWSPSHEELVIYDDKEYGGRADTWITLNHEAFHQYIFYFYGTISPHSWYNEGTGDFYSGYQIKNGRFRLKENPWRKSRIQEMLREGRFVPLSDLVRWSKNQYYGTNDLGFDAGMLYAQGWSFIYFLRTGKENCSGWDDSWDGILDTYLDSLAKSGDLEAAVDAAFEGVDWEAMEAAWKDYIG